MQAKARGGAADAEDDARLARQLGRQPFARLSVLHLQQPRRLVVEQRVVAALLGASQVVLLGLRAVAAVAVAAAVEPQLHGEERHLLLLEEHLLLLHSLLLQLACVSKHLLSFMLMRLSVKMLFWTIETMLSTPFLSSTMFNEVESTTSDCALHSAELWHLAPATASTMLWRIVLSSFFTRSRWT